MASAQGAHQLVVLLFVSAWHPPCKQMRVVCDQLASQFTQVQFAEVRGEEAHEDTDDAAAAAG